MTRVRTDNVFGTLTDNPLLIGATTMNSAGLANLAAVSSAEAIIVLDPNRVAGAPEIVVVTAHTGSATSATIVRGQFGTAARQHALGTEWVHGPIASNATSYVTAGDDQGDFASMRPWQAWTPTLTNLTLGNGTVTALFVREGLDTIHYRFRFILGSTSAVGTAPRFSLPVAAHANYVAFFPMGWANLLDAGTNNFPAKANISALTDVVFESFNAAGTSLISATVTATSPFTWTASDELVAAGTYQAAT